MNKDKLVVFGAGGHAKVVIDIIEKQGLYQIDCLADDDAALHGKEFFGYLVIGGKKALLQRIDRETLVIVAIGDNTIREAVSSWLQEHGYRLATAVHPSASIGRDVDIGDGTVVMAGVSINCSTRIGRSVIINTGASVDHDCEIGDCNHVAPGSVLCGGVSTGAETFVGAGATLIPNVTIGEGVMVGAGAVVIRDVPAGQTVAGIPAEPI